MIPGMKRFLTMYALSFWLTGATALSIACFVAEPALAQRNAAFAGRWTGYFENSTGDKGDDSLTLEEDGDGNLHGMWSGNIPIEGRRTDERTAELHGRTDTRSYRIFLKAHGDELTLKYTARRLDSSGEYEGEAKFKRRR
jgi:hypothetical protein